MLYHYHMYKLTILFYIIHCAIGIMCYFIVSSGNSCPEEESLFSDDDRSHSHGSSEHSHSHDVEVTSLLRSVILVVTLGIHTLFEGMAIGLIDDVDLLVTLVLAVMLHELCCAIALGVNLSQQKITKRAAVTVCVVFSVMMPAGIGLGLALGQVEGFAGLLLTAILQGVATGTFLYVLFIEIIPSSMAGTDSLAQIVLMLVGCIFMALIIVFADNESVHRPVTIVGATNASVTEDLH